MDFETIIRHYSINHRSRLQSQIDWLRRQLSLENAIITAANAEDERGLRYSHQTRITSKAIQEARMVLLEKSEELIRGSSFHQLWLTTKEALEPVNGIGKLYIYDAALRLGAYLDLFPDRVYLHAGTRKGARAFGFTTRRKEWLDMTELPKVVCGLPAYEIEDLLCIYKEKKIVEKGCD